MAPTDYLSFLNEISFLSYPTALAGLLLIIPLVILYLLKPKPKQIKIPTIMFILRIEKEKRFSSFLKRFIRDPILLLQIIIITLMVIAIAAPYITSLAERNPEQDIVIILDSSASMQSTDTAPKRYLKAQEIASNIINAMNDRSRASIILAGDLPIQLTADSRRDEAMEALQDARCFDSSTSMTDAITYSIDLLSKSQKEKIIYVISDFSHIKAKDIDLTRKLGFNRNITVELMKVENDGRNVGFIHAEVERFTLQENKIHLTLTVRNFNDRMEEILIEIFIDDSNIRNINEQLEPRSEKLMGLDFDTSSDAHFITVKLKPDDNLLLDNNIVLYLPPIRKYKILLITSEDSDNFLRHALDASTNVILDEAVFPVIPEFTPYDTVILGEFSQELSLPGVFQQLRKYVRDGGNLIVVSSDSMTMGLVKNMLPVELGRHRVGKKQVDLKLRHEILKDVLISNVMVDRYYEAVERNGSTTIAEIGNSPILSYWELGEGKVFLLGINPSPGWSNFYLTSSLPIFCFQLISWINSYESQLAKNNYETGDYLISTENVTIHSPENRATNSRNLLLDGVGVYRIKYADREDLITVNLLDERESDISNSTSIGDYLGEYTRERIYYVHKQDLTDYLIILVSLFIFLEIIAYRRRGKI